MASQKNRDAPASPTIKDLSATVRRWAGLDAAAQCGPGGLNENERAPLNGQEHSVDARVAIGVAELALWRQQDENVSGDRPINGSLSGDWTNL